MRHIRLILTDREYRTLLRLKCRVTRQERKVNADIARIDAQLRRRDTHTHIRDLLHDRGAHLDASQDLLQTLHEIDRALSRKQRHA